MWTTLKVTKSAIYFKGAVIIWKHKDINVCLGRKPGIFAYKRVDLTNDFKKGK